jgi:hypothetical protein
MTKPENLTAQERQELQCLKRQFPRLGQVADPRESLRAIFEDRRIGSTAAGRRRLEAFLGQVEGMGIEALGRFCQTLRRWLERVANYFRSRRAMVAPRGSIIVCVPFSGVPMAW